MIIPTIFTSHNLNLLYIFTKKVQIFLAVPPGFEPGISRVTAGWVYQFPYGTSICGPARVWSGNLLIKSQLLSQLSYGTSSADRTRIGSRLPCNGAAFPIKLPHWVFERTVSGTTSPPALRMATRGAPTHTLVLLCDFVGFDAESAK